jgi:flap endonuclease-1
MCILCGCDYCPTIPKVGPVRAKNIIQKYKTIENYLDKEQVDHEEFKQKYEASRRLFKVFKDKIDLNELPIHESKYDSEKLYHYLVHECSMNEKRIQNSLRR